MIKSSETKHSFATHYLPTNQATLTIWSWDSNLLAECEWFLLSCFKRTETKYRNQVTAALTMKCYPFSCCLTKIDKWRCFFGKYVSILRNWRYFFRKRRQNCQNPVKVQKNGIFLTTGHKNTTISLNNKFLRLNFVHH